MRKMRGDIQEISNSLPTDRLSALKFSRDAQLLLCDPWRRRRFSSVTQARRHLDFGMLRCLSLFLTPCLTSACFCASSFTSRPPAFTTRLPLLAGEARPHLRWKPLAGPTLPQGGTSTFVRGFCRFVRLAVALNGVKTLVASRFDCDIVVSLSCLHFFHLSYHKTPIS